VRVDQLADFEDRGFALLARGVGAGANTLERRAMGRRQFVACRGGGVDLCRNGSNRLRQRRVMAGIDGGDVGYRVDGQ